MVLIVTTSDVARHRVNEDYPCLVVHFTQKDDHFHMRATRLGGVISVANWMPRDWEIVDLLEKRFWVPSPKTIIKKMIELLQREGYEVKKSNNTLEGYFDD